MGLPVRKRYVGEWDQWSVHCAGGLSVGEDDGEAVVGGPLVVAGFFGPRKWLVQPESVIA